MVEKTPEVQIYNIIFPPELKKHLEQAASYCGCSMSDVVRFGVRVRQQFDDLTSQNRQLSLLGERKIQAYDEEFDPYFASIPFFGQAGIAPTMITFPDKLSPDLRRHVEANRMSLSEYVVESAATAVRILDGAKKQRKRLAIDEPVEYNIDNQKPSFIVFL